MSLSFCVVSDGGSEDDDRGEALTITSVIISTLPSASALKKGKKEKEELIITFSFVDGNDGPWNPSSIRRQHHHHHHCYCRINMTFQVWSRGHIIGSRNRLK